MSYGRRVDNWQFTLIITIDRPASLLSQTDLENQALNKEKYSSTALELSSLFQGQKGEKQAAEHLSKLGYSVIAKNWKSRLGEIDLIVKKKEVYFFVEVKFRKSKAYGSGAEAIHPLKQKKMTSAVLDYIQKNRLKNIDLRLAALIIEEENKTYSFDFYEFPLDLPTRYY